eukprot:gene904-53982_t
MCLGGVSSMLSVTDRLAAQWAAGLVVDHAVHADRLAAQWAAGLVVDHLVHAAQWAAGLVVDHAVHADASALWDVRLREQC